jgi:hypothetical protein
MTDIGGWTELLVYSEFGRFAVGSPLMLIALPLALLRRQTPPLLPGGLPELWGFLSWLMPLGLTGGLIAGFLILIANTREEWLIRPNELEIRRELFGWARRRTFTHADLLLERVWAPLSRHGGGSYLSLESGGRLRVLRHGTMWSGPRLLQLAAFVSQHTGWTLRQDERFGWSRAAFSGLGDLW